MTEDRYWIVEAASIAAFPLNDPCLRLLNTLVIKF
jgi:hypothetical protein